MPSAATLIAALSDTEIARRVGIPHDSARLSYVVRQKTVSTFDEFADLIGDYYNYHMSHTVYPGVTTPRDEAVASAKELLEQQYRRQNKTIVSAFEDARAGVSSGIRGVLDLLADAIKARSTEHYIREVFDRHVAPSSWETKVEVVRQFIRDHKAELQSTIRVDTPECYAHDYQDLIRAYAHTLTSIATVGRRG